MAEREYTEPTNEQLAAFMTAYARNHPHLKHLAVSPAILEWIFEKQPDHRATALRYHRAFQESMDHMSDKIKTGEYQCEYFLRSGKRCPNFNVPETVYCGLHQPEEQ